MLFRSREHLFALVRSALASVSLPAKTYKFKVMSLDAAGTSFVVMIDLAGSPDGALAALKTVEDLIRSTAAVGQDLQVQGVYWHFDPPSPAPQPSSTDAPRGAQDALAQRTPTGSVLEQIGVDEMLAFRASQERGREQLARQKVADLNEALDRASAKGGSGTRSSEDAQKSDRSPLSPTQFGDL